MDYRPAADHSPCKKRLPHIFDDTDGTSEMITSSERRRLIESHSAPDYARAAVAKAVAGLLIVIGLCAVGALTPHDEAAPPQSQAAAAR